MTAHVLQWEIKVEQFGIASGCALPNKFSVRANVITKQQIFGL